MLKEKKQNLAFRWQTNLSYIITRTETTRQLYCNTRWSETPFVFLETKERKRWNIHCDKKICHKPEPAILHVLPDTRRHLKWKADNDQSSWRPNCTMLKSPKPIIVQNLCYKEAWPLSRNSNHSMIKKKKLWTWIQYITRCRTNFVPWVPFLLAVKYVTDRLRNRVPV